MSCASVQLGTVANTLWPSGCTTSVAPSKATCCESSTRFTTPPSALKLRHLDSSNSNLSLIIKINLIISKNLTDLKTLLPFSQMTFLNSNMFKENSKLFLTR